MHFFQETFLWRKIFKSNWVPVSSTGLGTLQQNSSACTQLSLKKAVLPLHQAYMQRNKCKSKQVAVILGGSICSPLIRVKVPNIIGPLPNETSPPASMNGQLQPQHAFILGSVCPHRIDSDFPMSVTTRNGCTFHV